jgi:hypothetical protein
VYVLQENYVKAELLYLEAIDILNMDINSNQPTLGIALKRLGEVKFQMHDLISAKRLILGAKNIFVNLDPVDHDSISEIDETLMTLMD